MSDLTAQFPTAPQPSNEDAPPAPAFSLPLPRRLRIWPGVAIIAIQWLIMYVPGWVKPGTIAQFFAFVIGPLVGVFLLTIWWLFFSRIRWAERFLLLLTFAAVGTGAYFLYEKNFTFFPTIMYALPTVTTAWVAWLLFTPFLSWPIRRAGLVIVFVLGWGVYDLVRFDGVDGRMQASLALRWTKTAEDEFLDEFAAPNHGAPAPASDAPRAAESEDWPGFRGPNRDGRLAGVRIDTDWAKNPPKKLWEFRVGPGWGSFAVVGDRFYTQEQRDKKDEAVVCYSVGTGYEIWAYKDTTRFSETVSGSGPRATPTFHDGKIYALGANGQLNCLEAATGKLVWTRDIKEYSGAQVPIWGFSSSPLVAEGVVMVFAGGPNGKSVVAYNAASGEPAWAAGDGHLSYSSPQLSKLGGVEQVLITTDQGITAFKAKTGEILWKHTWPIEGQPRCIQPTVLSSTDVLIGTGMGGGTRRVHVAKNGDSWTDEAVWTTKAISAYFNDMVVYDNHIYGFDSGGIMTCLSLSDGKERWRDRDETFKNGQLLLLEDQGLLLIMVEKPGDVALVKATPDGLKELGRFQALKNKTWNHPVISHGKLFVRNSEKMACYQLAEESK